MGMELDFYFSHLFFIISIKSSFLTEYLQLLAFQKMLAVLKVTTTFTGPLQERCGVSQQHDPAIQHVELLFSAISADV